MTKMINHPLSAGIKIFILAIFIGVFCLMYKFATNSLEINKVDNPRIVALYLNGSNLDFICLDKVRCFPDIDLGTQIKEANDPVVHPLSIVSAYHGSDKKLYLLLNGSVSNYLAKVNLDIGQAQILDLNVLSSAGNDKLPNFFLGMGRLIHNKLVVTTYDGKIGIVQDDFSIKIVDLKTPIQDIIESTDSRIAVVGYGNLPNEKMQEKVFMININTGDVEEKKINGPQEMGKVVTVDDGLHNLYWVSSDNSTLNKFDIQAQKDMLSAPISASDAYAYTTLTGARLQYHNIWYYSRRCPCEGPVTALMMDMSTLKPVLNPEGFLKDEPESDRTFMIVPFGNDFLIGTHSHVFVVLSNGTVIDKYTLPKEWVERNYLLLEYRN